MYTGDCSIQCDTDLILSLIKTKKNLSALEDKLEKTVKLRRNNYIVRETYPTIYYLYFYDYFTR